MRVPVLSLLSSALFLTGCAAITAPTAPLATGVAIQGTVHGGQQPLANAHVYLFAANTTGYGGAGIPASSANASLSLLDPLITLHSDSLGAYVLTGAGGSFTITGDYVCSSGQQIYLYALGGNPGSGTNSAVGLMAALGACPAAGTFALSTPFVIVNEVSTIAAAYALAGFATDATHISGSGSAQSATGLANAFLTAGSLYNISGGVTALATTPGGTGIVPQAEIDTLGNILAACVNSSGASSTQCAGLFANAMSAGSSGVAPTDTATAAINIAHNPGNAVPTLFSLTTGVGTPFLPALSSAPNDFSIAILYFEVGVYSGPRDGLYLSTGLAIDTAGSVWTVNNDEPFTDVTDVAKFSNLGIPMSPSTGYTGGGLNNAKALAIDLNGNIWVANGAGDSISKFDSSGSPVSPAMGYQGTIANNPTLASLSSIAVDTNNDIWITGATLHKFSQSGAQVSPSAGYAPSGRYDGVAIDSSGYVYITSNANTVLKFSAAGSPSSTASAFVGGGINLPVGIAIDNANNVWTANCNCSNQSSIPQGLSVSEFNSGGSPLSPSAGFTSPGLYEPVAVALDGAGTAWISSVYSVGIVGINAAGQTVSPSAGFYNPSSVIEGVAIDNSGNIWTANYANITEYIGLAAPVVTPLAAALHSNMIASRP